MTSVREKPAAVHHALGIASQQSCGIMEAVAEHEHMIVPEMLLSA